jgi:hypothetical protein
MPLPYRQPQKKRQLDDATFPENGRAVGGVIFMFFYGCGTYFAAGLHHSV